MSATLTFSQAADRIQKLNKRPSNEVLLTLYGLFKQATEGDNLGKRPGLLDPKGRAKFDAWLREQGKNRTAAEQEYISLVSKLIQSDAS